MNRGISYSGKRIRIKAVKYYVIAGQLIKLKVVNYSRLRPVSALPSAHLLTGIKKDRRSDLLMSKNTLLRPSTICYLMFEIIKLEFKKHRPLYC